MPSSGLPIVSIIPYGTENDEMGRIYRKVTEDAAHALKMGLFTEWLESFIGAWNKTHDPIQSSNAGIIEWDM